MGRAVGGGGNADEIMLPSGGRHASSRAHTCRAYNLRATSFGNSSDRMEQYDLVPMIKQSQTVDRAYGRLAIARTWRPTRGC